MVGRSALVELHIDWVGVDRVVVVVVEGSGSTAAFAGVGVGIVVVGIVGAAAEAAAVLGGKQVALERCSLVVNHPRWVENAG